MFPRCPGSLGYSASIGKAPEISTYTLEMQGHPKLVQDSWSTTLSNKGTVRQDTCTKRVIATSLTLKVALGCDTSTEDVLGYIPSAHRVLDSNPM